MFLVRGGHMMGGGGHMMGSGEDLDVATRERHIGDLERENAQLPGAAPTAEVSELIDPRS